MDLETFNVFYTQLRQAKKVAIDLETDNLARYANRILTAHFCLDGYTAYNIPICHKDTPLKPEEVTFIQQQLKAYLQDGDSVEHVYHNAKFDIGVLTAQLGLDFYNHKVFDTCGGVFCLDENVRTYKHFKTHPYNLRRVAYQYGCAAYDEGEVGKQDRTNMANLPLLEIFEYASKDVIIPYQVSAFQEAEAVRRKYINWKAFLVDQLGAMTLVFVGMENKGILINKKYLIDLCSNDGTVQKLLNQVLDQFKQSPAARSVNEILVTRDRVIAALKEEKNKLKRSLTLLKKQIKTLEKPRRILKKDEKDAELVASIMQQNTINARLYQQLQGIDKLYNEAITSIGYVHDTIDKDVYKLKDYDLLVNSKNLSTSLQQIMKMLPSVSEFQPFIDGINLTQGRLSTLQSFRDIPVDVEVDWVFSVSTNECQQLLFFNVLGLDPVDVKKNGGGTTDKDFQDSYLHVPEVGYLATYNKYKKLMSTYIEGMMKRLESDPDSRLDGRLRADYGYRDVLTGRSSSRNPNFQNIVQRGELSKIVKSQFVAGKGEIYIKNDYNAAEVRQWANISQDYKLAATFRTGMVMRRELFLETDPVKREALQAKIKGEGDVHRLNYAFFFGKDPKDVTDEERTAVKAVIFGVMYGKSSFTLARDLKCSEEEAQKLLDKLFSTYDVAGNWIKQTKITTVNTLTAKSPIGRIRHLAAVLHHNTEVKSSTERKMCNSITQGFSSDMGYAGGRILQQIVYLLFQKQGYPLHLYENNTVHDSVEAITKFEHLPLSLYLVEQAFTTLMHLKYKQAFGMNWVIESEMDSELGCSIGTVRKFDWYKLPTLVREELTASQNVLGYHYTEEEKSEILRKFDHNYSIITRLKQLEVKQYLDFIKENPQQIYLKTVLLDKEKFDKVKNLLIF
jgi:DNA polymerase I-like protein with 3'-5' exonuclease and polymerase domains